MATFNTIKRIRPVSTYEFKPHGKRKFFDTWIEIDEVIHQVYLLAKALDEVDRLTLVPVLTGGGLFNTILGQKLNRQSPDKEIIEVPVVAKSYGSGQQSGNLEVYSSWIEKELIDDRDVVIIDDIYDTGRTADEVTELILSKFHPNSVRRAFLIRKDVSSAMANANDYYLFDLPGTTVDGGPIFYVGMGMDAQFRYRNLDRVIDFNSGRDTR